MSDSKPRNDPSMDDILASIRKIISDDEVRAATDPGMASSAPPQRPMQPAPARSEPGKPAPRSAPQSAPLSAPQAAVQSGSTPDSDDVLLLTELVEELPPLRPGVSAAEPMAKGVDARPLASPGISPIPSPAAMGINEPQPPIANPARPMTSPLGRDAGSRAYSGPERASRVVGDSESTPTAVSGKSVEDLVREMLRPMLQEWMDKNLPGIVEKAVEREIDRFPRR